MIIVRKEVRGSIVLDVYNQITGSTNIPVHLREAFKPVRNNVRIEVWDYVLNRICNA